MSRPLWLPLVAALSGCAVVPTPIEDSHMMGLTQANLDRVTQGNEPLAGAVSVYEAVARALKYNLDAQVETYDAALRGAEARLAGAQMLPSLVATAGYSARSNDLATGSLDLPTGIDVPPASVSSDRNFNSGDATLSWNVLDFALSYVRAQQASDRQLIAQENKRKVAQRIVEDTRIAYWRAVSSERLAQRFARMEERARRAIRNTRAAKAAGAETPMTALSYERELVQVLQTAERLRHELVLAKSQLAALINVPPGMPLKLVDVIEQPDPVVGHIGLEDLFAEAVFNRPEIRDVAYRQRINAHEAHAALLDLMPAIGLSASRSFSDDHFLLHNDWTGLGVTVADNLLKVVQLPARRAAVEAEGDVLRERALAVTATVMTQVLVSRIRQRNAAEQLSTAREYRDVQALLVKLLIAEKSSDLIGEQTLIREEMNLLIAEIQHDIALGGLQSASSNLMVSLGYDLQGMGIDFSSDVTTIATRVRAHWSNRSAVSDRGRYLAELEKARREAERLRIEAEQRRLAEARRIADANKQAAADAARLRQAEAVRLKREAERTRDDARRSRRTGAQKVPQAQPPATIWPWLWPTPDAPRAGGLKDTAPARRSTRDGQPTNKSDGVYSGTK
jgi:outer membrane protein TolC